jgi:hypothetical protein
MTKKLRRKKGGNNDDATDDIDHLPDDHTVADSVATSVDFEDDVSVDDLISAGGGSHCESFIDNAQARNAKAVETLAEVQDLLTEKRSAKRESGLRRIFRAITQYSDSETLVPFQQDLIQLAMSSLRGGTPAEQYAACRCLEAFAVVLGADQDEYYESVEPNLKRVVLLTSRAPMVRGAALRALCVSNFVCATDHNDNDDESTLLDLTESVAGPEYRNHPVPATLRATALECWSLLATTLFDVDVSGDDTGRGLSLLPLIPTCLDDSCLELRAAAGQCMALIHEARLGMGVEDGVAANTTERKYSQGGWAGSPQEDVVFEIQQRIAELSNQSGHSISKKAKKELRSAFREFSRTISDNESPEESIAFRGGSLELTSWKGIIQLQFVRHCLQGGFQIQLLTNPTLQTIFGADGSILNGSGNMSQLEKRLYMSKTSEAAKSAHLDMTKKRRARSNLKNHFITTDGEDI